MASPTARAQNVWETQNGNDFLQFLSQSGSVLGGVDSTGTGFGNFSSLRRVTGVISSASLLAMPGTKPTIVAAQGANTIIVPQALMLQYKFVTTAYTLGNADNTFDLVYAGSAAELSVFIPANGLMNQTANAVGWQAWDGATSQLQSAVANQAMQLTLNGTTPGLTLGDGTLNFTFLYYLFNL